MSEQNAPVQASKAEPEKADEPMYTAEYLVENAGRLSTDTLRIRPGMMAGALALHEQESGKKIPKKGLTRDQALEAVKAYLKREA